MANTRRLKSPPKAERTVTDLIHHRVFFAETPFAGASKNHQAKLPLNGTLSRGALVETAGCE